MNAVSLLALADNPAGGAVQALPPAIGAVATLLGLTYLAYRHPHMYRRMHLWFLGASVLVLLALIIHNAGIDLAFRELNDLIEADARTEAKARVDTMRFPFNWVLVVFGGLVAYLFFLLYLRRLLRRDRARSGPAEDAPRSRPTPQPKGTETPARQSGGSETAPAQESKPAGNENEDDEGDEDDAEEEDASASAKKKTRRRKKKGG